MPTTTTRTLNPTSRTIFDPEPDDPDELVEKKSEMSRIVPNSASDEAASTVWPNVVSTSPASRMTGTMSPSDVDASMIATKSGFRIDSTGWSRNAHATANANEATNASEIVLDATAQPGRVDLEPGQEQQEGQPEE